MKVCKECKEEKEDEEFRRDGGFQCKACYNTKKREYSNGLKQQWIEFFNIHKGNRCALCGYNRDYTALHFHHVFPVEKEFQISQKINNLPLTFKNQKVVLNELNKTVILCSNCHTEVHTKGGIL